MTDTQPRNARALATSVAGRPALVLEPSPPTVVDGPWFADDPATLAAGDDAVTPTRAGSLTWDTLAGTDAAVAEFAADHWLGALKRLPEVPAGYAACRNDYHRLAYAVVSNARKTANGKFGLRYTHGGFGTPFFGTDEQVRVQGTRIIVQRGDVVTTETITTLTRAAEFAGTVANADQAEPDTVDIGDVDRQLDVSVETGAFLGDWFGFGTLILEELRLLGRAADDVSRVQIWPGHFDPSIEIGSADAGRRASYGASPGDSGSDEPYLYVAPWGEIDRTDPYWNSETFPGSRLTYQDLLATQDQRETAVEFFARAYAILSR
ncbi:MAG: hypothetical protein ACC660_07030 [Acidimicrobiales bacterium]